MRMFSHILEDFCVKLLLTRMPCFASSTYRPVQFSSGGLDGSHAGLSRIFCLPADAATPCMVALLHPLSSSRCSNAPHGGCPTLAQLLVRYSPPPPSSLLPCVGHLCSFLRGLAAIGEAPAGNTHTVTFAPDMVLRRPHKWAIKKHTHGTIYT
jgi:hypothetical protein